MCVGRRRRAASGQLRRTSSWLPPMPPEVTITAWARSSKSPASSRVARLAARARVGARRRRVTPVDRAAVTVSSSTRWRKRERRPARAPAASRTRRTNGSTTPGPGAPGDVEARHRVAVPDRAVAAALGPADHREEAHALRVQPGALLAGGEVDVGLGPAPRPVVLGAVEAGACRASPASASSCESLMPQAPLLGRVDQEQPAERPERLAAERRLRLLLDERSRACRRRPARRWRPARPGRRRRRWRRIGHSYARGRLLRPASRR